MDKIIESASFPKTELEFYPILGLDKKSTMDLDEYLAKYRKLLTKTLAAGSVPVISTEPGLGFSHHTQEILSKEYGTSVITTIEPKLIIDGYEVMDVINGIRNQHAKDGFVIINDILAVRPYITSVLLNVITNACNEIRFVISVYKSRDAG